MNNHSLKAQQSLSSNAQSIVSLETEENWKRSILPYAILGILLIICEFLPNFYDKSDTTTWAVYLILRIIIYVCAFLALYQTNKYYKNKITSEINEFLKKNI